MIKELIEKYEEELLTNQEELNKVKNKLIAYHDEFIRLCQDRDKNRAEIDELLTETHLEEQMDGYYKGIRRKLQEVLIDLYKRDGRAYLLRAIFVNRQELGEVMLTAFKDNSDSWYCRLDKGQLRVFTTDELLEMESNMLFEQTGGDFFREDKSLQYKQTGGDMFKAIAMN